jgi:ABC-type polysaccharide/polyol phosphate export permease
MEYVAANTPEEFVIELISETYRNRELIWALSVKDLQVRYKRSALGFLWALLNPLLMMIILTMVFSTLMPTQIHHYSIFLMSTLLPWTFFSQSLAYSADSIVVHGDLLKKVRVAKTVFPIAAIVSNIINFCFSLAPLVLLMIVLRFPFHWTLIYAIVPFTSLVLLALGFGFFFAMANVFFRDVAHILQILLQAWYFLSPVMYPIDIVPKQYQVLFRLNPLLYPLNGFRLRGWLPSVSTLSGRTGLLCLATLSRHGLSESRLTM